MHRKHGIDRGTEVSGRGEGIPVGSGVPPLLEKLVKTYFQHNRTAPDFRDLVWHLSNRYCPWAYSTAVSHPTSQL